MLVLQDELLLESWLGRIPDEVRAECELWTKWYHSAGAGGALGPLALISLLRQLKYAPPQPKQVEKTVDWARMPVPTSVEVRVGDVWLPGTYVGTVTGGTLAIRHDGDDWVHEYPRVAVRLPAAEPVVIPAPVQEPEPVAEPVAEEVPVAPEPAVADTAELPVVDLPGVAIENPLAGVEIPAGAPVLVAVGDDTLDGICVEYGPETVLVRVSGEDEPRQFPASAVASA